MPPPTDGPDLAEARAKGRRGNRAMKAEGSWPAITVIAAFHQPAMALARRQSESLLAQRGVRLSVVAVLDGAETAGNAELVALIEACGFTMTGNETAQGIMKAFATGLDRALAMAGGEDHFFAYCDQDDVWHPDKLARSIAAARLGKASLVHCDARVVSETGELLAPSLFAYESRQDADNLLEMLLLNTVTGMTAVFPRRTAVLAKALMDGYDDTLLHDHITAVAAASLGPVVRVEQALTDYIQHTDNLIGARVHRSGWRRRAIGPAHVGAYRQTSAKMFRERRSLCVLLEAQGHLPRALAVMFKAGPEARFATRFWHYSVAVLALFGKGQFRRSMLCLRMMDVALWLR